MVFAACKQELGWTDYRFTNFKHIEKWWEIIFCAYTIDISKNCQTSSVPNFVASGGFRQLSEVQR